MMLKKAANYLSQSNSLDSPSLDKVICFVTWHLSGIFPHLPNLPRNFGLVKALTINPINEIESVGIEHVSHLELAIEDSRFSFINRHDETFKRDIAQSMKIIGENGRNLKHLTISFPHAGVPWRMYSKLSRLLGDAFNDMFKGLKNFKSLKIVELKLEIMYYLEKYPDTFSNYSGAMITHLNVTGMTLNCSGATLLEINRRFPNLTHFCCYNASFQSDKEGINISPEDLPKLVEDIFPDITKVEIHLSTFSNNRFHDFEVSKIPFHKCVMEKK